LDLDKRNYFLVPRCGESNAERTLETNQVLIFRVFSQFYSQIKFGVFDSCEPHAVVGDDDLPYQPSLGNVVVVLLRGVIWLWQWATAEGDHIVHISS